MSIFTGKDQSKEISYFDYRRGLYRRLLKTQGMSEEEADKVPDAPPRDRDEAEERECAAASARLAEITRKKREQKDSRWEQKEAKREKRREATKGVSHKTKVKREVVAERYGVTVFSPVEPRPERRVRAVVLKFDEPLPEDEGGPLAENSFD